MSLPVAVSVEGPRTTVNATVRGFAVLVCAASAGVHAGLVPAHLGESGLLGAAFAVSVVGLTAAALRLRADGSAAPWVPLLLLAVACSYVLSRTTGLGVLSPDPEPVEPLGLLTTSAEVLAALAVLCLPRIGKEAR
jgi:hypothetical protein